MRTAFDCLCFPEYFIELIIPFKIASVFNLSFARERVKMFPHFKWLRRQHNALSRADFCPRAASWAGLVDHYSKYCPTSHWRRTVLPNCTYWRCGLPPPHFPQSSPPTAFRIHPDYTLLQSSGWNCFVWNVQSSNHDLSVDYSDRSFSLVLSPYIQMLELSFKRWWLIPRPFNSLFMILTFKKSLNKTRIKKQNLQLLQDSKNWFRWWCNQSTLQLNSR